MLGKMMSFGFNVATLPMRVALRGTVNSAKTMLSLPGQYKQFVEDVRLTSDEIARELEVVMAQIESEMAEQAAHLSPEQERQAANMAFASAEQHLSQAAVDMLRAFSLLSNNNQKLQHSHSKHLQTQPAERKRKPIIIDHEDS